MKTPEEMAYDYGEKFDGVEISKNDINIAWYDGYKAAAPQWISVKDRLPEIGQAVNCYGRAAYESGSSVIPAWYIHKWNQWQSCEGDGCGGGGYLFDVTHWMPLPEPPKEEK